ncbi:MAG: hypothetical protein MR902_02405 [Campylobacter sp.]|nr:hypothetical protein [Campylobacter sp.]
MKCKILNAERFSLNSYHTLRSHTISMSPYVRCEFSKTIPNLSNLLFIKKSIQDRIGLVKKNSRWGDGSILLVCNLAPKWEFYLNRSFMGS